MPDKFTPYEVVPAIFPSRYTFSRLISASAFDTEIKVSLPVNLTSLIFNTVSLTNSNPE